MRADSLSAALGANSFAPDRADATPAATARGTKAFGPTAYRRMSRKELTRWGASFAVILALHGAVAASMLIRSSAEGDTYDEVTAIEVDFSTDSFQDAPRRDVAAGEEQMQSDAAPPPVEKAELKTEVKEEPVPVPREADPEVALDVQDKKKEEDKKDDQEKTPSVSTPTIAAAMTTAPTAAAARTARIVSWKRRIALHLQRMKRYPAQAQAAQQHGTAKVHFVVSRQGMIMARSIVASSGVSALDKEAMDLLIRAEPLPLPPDEAVGSEFAFSVPVAFELK